MHRRATQAIFLCGVLFACTAGPAKEADSGVRPFTTTTLGTFDEPWAMAFLPGTSVAAITHKAGKVTLWNSASGARRDVAGVPKVATGGQGGLGDVLVVASDTGRFPVYLSWVEAGAGKTKGAVIGRGMLVDIATNPRIEGMSVIWRQAPKVEGNGHFSHRMLLSPDGKTLFLTSGDRQKFTPAQSFDGNLGKVLRLTLDGQPAPGNPWAAKGGVAAQFWSMGHRNLLGIAFDGSGRLWESEMGPKGGDEVNLIEAGRNYGWPKASNGSHYDGSDIPDHKSGDGFEPPKVWWNPAISPGGLMIYRGAKWPQWKGDAFVPALSGEALIRVDLDGTSVKKADQWPMGARIRAVVEGPKGEIYVLEDGDGAKLLRLDPVTR